MIQAIIEAMKQEIAKYKLEVLQHYPKDLEIDMATLERFAHPGMKIAWMVGDSHTHIAPLGVHQKLNEIPTYLTRLANNCNDLQSKRAGPAIQPILGQE